jgi:hypothetical protein
VSRHKYPVPLHFTATELQKYSQSESGTNNYEMRDKVM